MLSSPSIFFASPTAAAVVVPPPALPPVSVGGGPSVAGDAAWCCDWCSAWSHTPSSSSSLSPTHDATCRASQPLRLEDCLDGGKKTFATHSVLSPPFVLSLGFGLGRAAMGLLWRRRCSLAWLLGVGLPLLLSCFLRRCHMLGLGPCLSFSVLGAWPGVCCGCWWLVFAAPPWAWVGSGLAASCCVRWVCRGCCAPPWHLVWSSLGSVWAAVLPPAAVVARVAPARLSGCRGGGLSYLGGRWLLWDGASSIHRGLHWLELGSSAATAISAKPSGMLSVSVGGFSQLRPRVTVAAAVFLCAGGGCRGGRAVGVAATGLGACSEL